MLTVFPDEVNGSPDIVTPIGGQIGIEGTAFALDVSPGFDDPEDDPLTFGVEGLPSSLTLTSPSAITGLPSTFAMAPAIRVRKCYDTIIDQSIHLLHPRRPGVARSLPRESIIVARSTS